MADEDDGISADYSLISRQGVVVPCYRRFLCARWSWFNYEYDMMILPVGMDSSEIMTVDPHHEAMRPNAMHVTPVSLSLPVCTAAIHALLLWLATDELPLDVDPVALYDLRRIARSKYGLEGLAQELLKRQEAAITSPRSSMGSATRRSFTPPSLPAPTSPLPDLPRRGSQSDTESPARSSFIEHLPSGGIARVSNASNDARRSSLVFSRVTDSASTSTMTTTSSTSNHPPLSPSQRSTESHSVLDPIAQSPAASSTSVHRIVVTPPASPSPLAPSAASNALKDKTSKERAEQRQRLFGAFSTLVHGRHARTSAARAAATTVLLATTDQEEEERSKQAQKRTNEAIASLLVPREQDDEAQQQQQVLLTKKEKRKIARMQRYMTANSSTIVML